MSVLDITPYSFSVGLQDRIEKNQHKPLVLWLTGLSGSGKSTLANFTQKQLFNEGKSVFVLDGDNIRSGLNRDLNFSDESRKENIRRVAEVASLFCQAGFIVIASFISPFEEDRILAKQIIGAAHFKEIFISAELEICENRDVKGLYAKARSGEIKQFTGIDSAYEPPKLPDLKIETGKFSIQECGNTLVDFIQQECAI